VHYNIYDIFRQAFIFREISKNTWKFKAVIRAVILALSSPGPFAKQLTLRRYKENLRNRKPTYL
jgi:hypothetical protein